MACYDGNRSEKDHGTLDDSYVYDVMSETDACGDTWYSTWQLNSAVTAADYTAQGGEAYDEFDTGKWYQLSTWFSNVPDPMVDESCMSNSQNPFPENATVRVEHPSDMHQDVYSFDLYEPEEGDGSNNTMLQVALTIVGASTSATLLTAGIAAMKDLLVPYQPITFEKNNLSYDRRQLKWDLDIQGYDQSDFPQDQCGNVGVRFRLDEGSAADTTDNLHVQSASKILVRNFTYPYGDCACDSSASSILFDAGWVTSDAHFSYSG